MVRGLIQQFSHEFEPALASLTKASELNPTSADPLLWRSAIYMVQALIFSTESAEQTLALQPSSAWQTFSQHVVEGVWHIWTGFDHIFLLALLLPAVVTRQAGQWVPVPGLMGALKEVVKVVTAFTLAHSITLTLAGLQIISLAQRLFDL